MKDFKIGKKLTVAFGAIGAMLVIVIITAIIGFTIVGDNFTQFYTGPFEITYQSMNVRRAIQSVAKNINYAFVTNDMDKTNEYIEAAQGELDVMEEGIGFLKENFQGDKSLVDNLEKAMENTTDYKNSIFELAAQNKNDEAKEIYFNQYNPYLLEANGYLTKINKSAQDSAEDNYDGANKTKIVVLLLMCFIGAAALCITVALSLYIVKSLVSPIKELENAADSLKKGELDISITYESKDELGSLALSFRETCSFLKTIVADIDMIIRELSEGNFTINTNCEEQYIGAFNPILMQLRNMISKLSFAMRNIKGASDQVSIGSSQLAESAQSLAEGATDQAGAIEELTATIANVTSTAYESAENSNKAFEKAKGYELEAHKGNEEMSELIASMERINETSKQIGNIISDIEDIASQTNLLSLNAAIEAARAGEAGKGFAVVADQIRKLADDSAQSAVETRRLIENSVAEIERGNDNTHKTSQALEKVIEGIKELSVTIKEASDMSSDQLEAMKQVEQGIEQISGVVQNNSAVAEETSATSEELSAQASTMNDLVDQFTLSD